MVNAYKCNACFSIQIWAASWENQCSVHAKTKAQISLAVTAKLISAFVFASWIVQSLYFLNTKFQASSHLQWLYSLVCVGPGQNPHCWFSLVAAHLCCVQYNLSNPACSQTEKKNQIRQRTGIERWNYPHDLKGTLVSIGIQHTEENGT